MTERLTAPDQLGENTPNAPSPARISSVETRIIGTKCFSKHIRSTPTSTFVLYW